MNDQRQSDSPPRHAGDANSNQLEDAALECLDMPAIPGLVRIYRDRPADGGKFYPSRIEDARKTLDLPASLNIKGTGETFVLSRLQATTDGEAGFEVSFEE